MSASLRAPLAPGSVSLRLYPHQLDQPTAVLDELQYQAALAIRSGFEGVMLSERHGGAWGQIPNPLQAAGWLLGAMPEGWVAPCPLLLPLRRTQVAAEEIAWLDARFAGRVGVGFGSGGNEADFRVVGVPFEERNERFDRSLRDIVGLLRGDGDLVPGDPAIARARRVGIPLLSAAMSPHAAWRAAELGIGIIGSSLLAEDRTRALADRFHESGGTGPHVVIVRVWLGAPPWELIDRQLGEYRHASGGAVSTAAEEGLIHSDDAADIASRVVQRLRATSADALNVRVHIAGLDPAVAREQIEAIGRDVLPRGAGRVGCVSDTRPLDDADLAALRSVEGADLEVSVRPYVEYATVDSMRNFARAYGDDNPLFGDEDYGRSSPWGTIVAPPLFPIATGIPVAASGEPAKVMRQALRGVAVEVIDDRWTLHRVIEPGVRLVRTDSIAAVTFAETDTAPTAAVTTRSTYITGDVLYATHDRVRVHGGRSIADAIGSDDHRGERAGKARYDDDALAEIERVGAAWSRRGSARLAASDLTVGATIGPMVKGPLTITDLVAYRGGVGPGPFGVEPLDLARHNRRVRPDFYDRDETGAWDARERLHWDEAYAQRCGHPSAYDYTHTRLNWMVHLLTDWMGDHARLETISFAHVAHNYVGDTHWIDATIRAVDTEHDVTRVAVDLRGVNQLGHVTCRGDATVVL